MTEQDLADLCAYIVQKFARADLSVLLNSDLNRDLDVISSAADIETIAVTVVEVAARDGWSDRLLYACLQRFPGDPRSIELFARLGAIPNALQCLLRQRDPFIPVRDHNEALEAAMSRVFLVEVDGQPCGTGFLIGPDLGLTNCHVFERFVGSDGTAAADAAARVRVRFDFVSDAEKGHLFSISPDWLVTFSRHHELDRVVGEHDCSNFVNALDFLVFRFDRSLGLSLSPRSLRQRGWYDLSVPVPELAEGDRLIVIQHPLGARMCFDDGQVTWINGNHTRVRYEVNTIAGSSGSIGLNNRMEVVVLHHAGRPSFNQGIPVKAVVAKIRASGFGTVITPAIKNFGLITHVSKREPVLDRQQLQTVIEEMRGTEGPRVLCIDGDPGTGRQYSAKIIERLIGQSGHCCALLEMEACAGAQPDEPCKLLALELGIGLDGIPPKPDHRQSTRWSKLLATWLGGLIARRYSEQRVPVWLVIDCVTDASLSEEIQGFIVSLAEGVLRRPETRVILIGAEPFLPRSLSQRAERSRTAPIVPQDLSSFLVEIATRMAVPLEEADADALAAKVFDELPEDGVERWDKLIQSTIALSTSLTEPSHNGA